MSRLRRRRNGALIAPVVVLLALVGAACGSEQSPVSTGAPTVMVTTGIWADVVANLACAGDVEVELLVPPGVDPHGFEPSLADRAAMEDAELVVANGLGLEEILDDTLDAVSDAGVPVVRVAELAGDEAGDPHVWFDPRRVSAALDGLAEALISAAGLDPGEVAGCVSDYRTQLAALDEEIATLVATLPEEARTLVTNHDALGYFAARYGFDVLGTVIPAASTLAQASPAQLEALADEIEAAGVPAIFAETQHDTDDAEALAERVGDIEVVTLFTETLGEPGSGIETYVDFLRSNAQAIVEALTPRSP